MAFSCISPGDFMDSIDLKDIYFSVPFFPAPSEVLMFSLAFQAF